MKNRTDIEKKIEDAVAKTSKAEREAALMDATAFIDKEFQFRGEPLTKSQGLSWPRKNAFFDDGSPIRGVPEAVKQATARLSHFMLADIPMTQATLAEIIGILLPVIEERKPN